MKQMRLHYGYTFILFLFINLLSAQKIVPIVDTYIDQNQPKIAQGSSGSKNIDKLVIRRSNNLERISFMEFNLENLSKGVKNAELYLYLFNTNNLINNASNTSEIVDIYEVTSGDLNEGMTWENSESKFVLSQKPVSSLEINIGSVVSESFKWYKFDLKDIVNKAVSTSSKTKSLKLAFKARSSNLILIFYSTETLLAKNRPYLDIKI